MGDQLDELHSFSGSLSYLYICKFLFWQINYDWFIHVAYSCTDYDYSHFRGFLLNDIHTYIYLTTKGRLASDVLAAIVL